MKILTIYDGTLQSKKALKYGLTTARKNDAEILVLSVFQTSLFVDYDAGPKAEELARAEAARHQREAEVMIREAEQLGTRVRTLTEDGNAVDESLRIAQAENVSLIIAPPRYRAIDQKAPCAVRLVPGTILVPSDNTDSLSMNIESIVDEASASGSRVMVLGIVPIHLYSPAEKAELDRIKKETTAAVRKIRTALKDQGVDSMETIRSGYPDEEILKAAAENAVSLIMLPAGGKSPSELTKAAAILLDEPQRVHLPIRLLQTANS